MPKTLWAKCLITRASTQNVPRTKGTSMGPNVRDASYRSSGISTKTIAENATKDFTSTSQPANASTSQASRNTRRTSRPLKTFTTTGTLRRSKDRLQIQENRFVQAINLSLTSQRTNALTAVDRLTCLTSQRIIVWNVRTELISMKTTTFVSRMELGPRLREWLWTASVGSDAERNKNDLIYCPSKI